MSTYIPPMARNDIRFFLDHFQHKSSVRLMPADRRQTDRLQRKGLLESVRYDVYQWRLTPAGKAMRRIVVDAYLMGLEAGEGYRRRRTESAAARREQRATTKRRAA